MKKLTTLLLSIVFSIAAFAQDFEGSITFKLKLSGDNVQQMQGFMPDSYVYHFRDGNMLFKINGGMTAAMLGDFLVKGKKDESYMIKHSEKTAYKLKNDGEDKADEAEQPEVEKMDETAEIAGYECQKYRVVMNTQQGQVTQYMWVTDEILPKRPKKSNRPKSGNLFVEGIEGFPLKVMSTTMGMTTIMVADEVSTDKPDKNLFEVPDDYSVEEMDMDAMMKSMGGGQ